MVDVCPPEISKICSRKPTMFICDSPLLEKCVDRYHFVFMTKADNIMCDSMSCKSKCWLKFFNPKNAKTDPWKEFVHGVCHTKDMLTVCSLTLKYVRTAELWIEKMSNRFQLNFGLSFECVQCFGNLFNSVLNVEHALSLVWSSSDASYNLPPRQYQCGYATISGFKTITSKPLTSNMITNTNHHHHHHHHNHHHPDRPLMSVPVGKKTSWKVMIDIHYPLNPKSALHATFWSPRKLRVISIGMTSMHNAWSSDKFHLQT